MSEPHPPDTATRARRGVPPPLPPAAAGGKPRARPVQPLEPDFTPDAALRQQRVLRWVLIGGGTAAGLVVPMFVAFMVIGLLVGSSYPMTSRFTPSTYKK